MNHTIEGTIIKIDETLLLANNFKKREFVIRTFDVNPKNQQEIKFEVIGDSVDYLDDLNISDDVKVAFILRGNEYNGKYYVNLRAIAFGLLEEDNNTTEDYSKYIPKLKTIISEFEETEDDLPF